MRENGYFVPVQVSWRFPNLTMKSLNLLSAVAVLALAGSTQAAVFATSNAGAGTSFSVVAPGQHAGTVFTVGAQPIEVTHIGGFDAAAHTGAQLRLFNSTGATLVAESVNYTGSGGYQWVQLDTPVTLAAGSQFAVAVGGFLTPVGGATGLGNLSYNQTGVTANFETYTIGNMINGTPYVGLGNFSAGNFQYTVVPEPETYAMIAGLGLVGFGLWRRRQAK